MTEHAAADTPWTVARVLSWAATDLENRGSASPRLDAELMLAQVLDCARVKLIIDAKRPLDKAELAAYRTLHKRRRVGEPIAYLRGEKEFYSRRFVVDARVLVPRPDTEILVETVLRRSRHLSLCARVLDLCTGSGCVAITLKKERPTTTVYASDVSGDALLVARDNCLRLGAWVALLHTDLFEGLESLAGKLDVIAANPPYISEADMAQLPRDVRAFEPNMALQSGPDGLTMTRKIIADAPQLLAKNGLLALEIEAKKGAVVAALFSAAGFSKVEIDRDYAGHERVVSGIYRRPAA